MGTANFKLLLNALRLGQPQDPQAAIRAIAEELAAQEQELEELRRRLQVATSASNLLEAKAVRLERELEVFRARRNEALTDEGDHAGPLSRAVLGAGQQHQPPQHQHQHQHQQVQQQQVQQHQQHQQVQQQQQPQPQHQPPQHQPPHQHQRVPAPTQPSHQAPSQQQQQQQQQPTQQQARAQAQRRQAPPSAPPPPPSDPGTDDGFQVETMVVSRQDLEQLRRDEAPFQITPAGQRAPAPARSIPGSPWTRARVSAEAAPPSQAPLSRAPVSQAPPSQPPASAGPTSKTGPSVLAGAEPPRSERPPRAPRHDEDGETFPDSGGGLPSLAAALGLSPNDPRILALRPSPGAPSREANEDADSLEGSPGDVSRPPRRG